MNVIELKNLTRKFGDFIAVNDISLTIKQGKIYGFLGPNGSGKSTTIKMLCGLLKPTSGEGSVLGIDINTGSEDIKEKIGYMSQKYSLYDDLTVGQNLEFYAGMYNLGKTEQQTRIAEILELTKLSNYCERLTDTLSQGFKQRLALGCAILHKPEILFLDEPTSGVDPKSRRVFWEIIYDLAQQQTTIMVTTHFMDEAEHCDEIGFIFEGNLIASLAPDKLKESIPGKLVQISTYEPMVLYEQLVNSDLEYLDMYVFGSNIHLLMQADSLIKLQDFRYEEITPSLEDVFVYLVKSRRRE